MKRTVQVAVLLASAFALLGSACTTQSQQPTSQPSQAASPSNPVASLPPSSSPSPSQATATTIESPSSSQLNPIPEHTPPGEPIAEGPSAATDLRSLGFCDPASPSTSAMGLTWRPSGKGEQLVAVATLPDGFDTGRYTVSANLRSTQDQYSVSPVEPGGVYYWRVLTKSGDGWAASEVASFTGTSCVVDNP